jgi:hypothetical protein
MIKVTKRVHGIMQPTIAAQVIELLNDQIHGYNKFGKEAATLVKF